MSRRAARRPLRVRPGAEAGQAPRRRAGQGARAPGHQGRHRRRRPDGQPARAALRPRLEVPVVLTDLDEERVAKGVGYVHAEIDKLLAKGRLSPDKAEPPHGPGHRVDEQGRLRRRRLRHRGGLRGDDGQAAGVRRGRGRRLARVRARDQHLVAVDHRDGQRRCEHPERVVGFHFFNPVAVMPLLEIIPGEATDDATLATAFAIGRRWARRRSGSRTRRRSSSTGCSAASWARSRGSSTRAPRSRSADRAVAGLAPMPPFVLLGLVGPAIALHNSETLAPGLPATASTSRRACSGSSRPASAASTDLEDGRPVLDPEVLALVEQPDRPGRARPSSRSASGCSACSPRRSRRMLDEGVVAGADGHRPRDDHRRRLPVLERRPHARCSTARASPSAVTGPPLPAGRRRERPRLSALRGRRPAHPDDRRRRRGRVDSQISHR